MNNELVFIRHAKTKIDKEISISEWDLTEDGYEHAGQIKNIPEFQDVDILISSTEKKSFLTIKPLVDKLEKEIIQIKELGEVVRGDGETLSSEEYDEMKSKLFSNLYFSADGWESANSALERYGKAVEEIDNKYEDKKILLCTHGTVMTLYFAKLQNQMGDLMNRRKNMGEKGRGIVKDNKVVKDILK